ncbi:Protein strictosidine synthase-like 11 [Vitis vinifera]|uniref:Protein strictosidine synthase-like 11 n=1 Tax=Vitis vinifera TaxID=29760 RepID=A0A438JYR3_VITVI|nr:Protein strictosidine synthase-like 11 [Vitis vinifera]
MGIIFAHSAVAMLFLFLFLFSFPSTILSNRIFIKLPLPKNVTSPYSFAFDQLGGGPYTGVTDGRIFKYGGPRVGFTEFAFTAPNRSKEVCDGTRDINLGPICGRPLGLGYDHSSIRLYIADAYFGLLAVGSNGGPATQAATSAEGVPFRFLSGLDVDPVTGTVFITDFSTEYELRDIRQALVSGNATVLSDTTGRLLKYDPRTSQVTVLLRNLSGAVGTALSTDRSFILVTEFNANRIQKFWLEGTKASTAEILVGLEGRPTNIRTTLESFWVAVSIQSTPTTVPTAQRIDPYGNILESLNFAAQYGSNLLSEVQEYHGALYIGAGPSADFVGYFKV